MWQTLAAWFAGNAVKLIWAFLSNLVKARADDPRLSTFIKEQIVYLQATAGSTSGKDKLFAVADQAMIYAKNFGIDVGYSTLLTLTAALFDELAPRLPALTDAWINGIWKVKPQGLL